MELLNSVGTKRVNGRLDSYGVFHCGGCGKDVERPLANGRRNKTCGCRIEKPKATNERICMRCQETYSQVVDGGVLDKSRAFCPRCMKYYRYGRRRYRRDRSTADVLV